MSRSAEAEQRAEIGSVNRIRVGSVAASSRTTASRSVCKNRGKCWCQRCSWSVGEAEPRGGGTRGHFQNDTLAVLPQQGARANSRNRLKLQLVAPLAIRWAKRAAACAWRCSRCCSSRLRRQKVRSLRLRLRSARAEALPDSHCVRRTPSPSRHGYTLFSSCATESCCDAPDSSSFATVCLLLMPPYFSLCCSTHTATAHPSLKPLRM